MAFLNRELSDGLSSARLAWCPAPLAMPSARPVAELGLFSSLPVRVV